MRAPRIPAIVQSRRLAEFDSVLTHGVVRHKNLEHDKAVIDGHQYLVWCGGAAFIIHNYPRQYFDGPAVAEYISDPQLALLVADHQGSLSVDWLSGDAPEMQQWDYIGHLLAELSSERCVALLVPAKETVMPFRPNTIRLLRGPNVLERLGFSE